MKRLSSYLMYLFIIAALPLLGLLIYLIVNHDDLIGIIIFSTGLFCMYFFRMWGTKRLFYNNGLILAYDLFTSKYTEITKDQIRDFEGSGFSTSSIIFKLVYYDSNENLKTMYFIRNFLLDDFDEIISTLKY